jgi:hypothetical protein
VRFCDEVWLSSMPSRRHNAACRIMPRGRRAVPVVWADLEYFLCEASA